MGKIISIVIHWSIRQIRLLGWRQFVALISDTIQKLGIAGVGLGIYQEDNKAIWIGITLIFVSGCITLLLNRK